MVLLVSVPGSNHLYLFLNPKNPDCDPDLPNDIDWEFAQKEIAQAKGFTTGSNASLTKGKEKIYSTYFVVLFFSDLTDGWSIHPELNRSGVWTQDI